MTFEEIYRLLEEYAERNPASIEIVTQLRQSFEAIDAEKLEALLAYFSSM